MTLRLAPFLLLLLAAPACTTFEATPTSRPCRLLDDARLLGTEDLTVDPDTGLAYLSADDRTQPPRRQSPGGIFAYDVQQGTLRRLALRPELPFHPHGIGLYTGGDGTRRLFVVNHRARGDDRVEIFILHDDHLAHAASLADARLLHSPNDVVPVGPQQFYVTNYRGARSGLGRLLEQVFRRKLSYLLYYDGTALQKVDDGLGYVNGVNATPDGGTIIATTTFGEEVIVYDRHADGSLARRQVIDAGTGADNVEIAPDGALWIGAHPDLTAFARYALRQVGSPLGVLGRGRAPAQVLRLPYDAAARRYAESPEVIYESDGDPLSGSSVAAPAAGTLLIGSVFETVLVCDWP